MILSFLVLLLLPIIHYYVRHIITKALLILTAIVCFLLLLAQLFYMATNNPDPLKLFIFPSLYGTFLIGFVSRIKPLKDY
jgi:peptidoglycan/LPS O-acetylase OafA/YrhL